jgi:hypothetical protein
MWLPFRGGISTQRDRLPGGACRLR